MKYLVFSLRRRFYFINSPNKLINFSLILAFEQLIWFLKKKEEIMKNKSLINECKCIHCQQKLDQINNSRLYWSKLILSKTLN